MSDVHEWNLVLSKEDTGEVTACLYEVTDDLQLGYIDSTSFGPFDTALDVSQWFLRHWSPRARLPLR